MAKKELSLKQKIIRTSVVAAIIAAVILLAYFILKWTGALEHVNTVEKITNLIQKAGIWAILVFIFIQFLQTTVVPIPAAVTTIAGAIVFGPLMSALYSLIGIYIGSIFSFWLGRRFGRKLAYFMIGEESTNKWAKRLGNGKYVFMLMMLFPAFPDDILCIVAGLTTMSWRFFIITNIITRPIAVFTLAYFGSGQIIPYTGYWLILWAAIVLVIAVLFYLSYKYSAQIENFVTKLGAKLTQKSRRGGFEPATAVEASIEFSEADEVKQVKAKEKIIQAEINRRKKVKKEEQIK